MPTKEYMGIAVPKNLAEQVKPLLYPLGYRSVSEFAIKAIRDLMEKETIRMEMREDDRKKTTYMPIEHE